MISVKNVNGERMKNLIKLAKILGVVCIMFLIFTPLIIFLLILRNNNKTVVFTPKFEIKDIETLEVIDPDALQSALNKVKGSFNLD